MQITRSNYSQYANLVQQMMGNGNNSGNSLSECDYGNFALRFKPVNISFTKPNWDNIMTKRDKPAMSEEDFEKAIKELAQKEFATGKRDDAAYRKLCMQHGETVSPDRKAMYEASMKKTGGKMNAACMFWDSNGNKSLSYNPESGNWKAISTEEEFARARLFTSIYNDELARLRSVYGEKAKGTVSFQQIQNDLAAGGESVSMSSLQYGNSIKNNSISRVENAFSESIKNNPSKTVQAKEMEVGINSNVAAEKMKRLEEQLRNGTFKSNSDFDMKA